MSRYRPSFEEFARCIGESASCVPVYRQLTGDGLTPVSAFSRIERAAPSFLFESVIGGEKVGRFSFLGTEPFLTLRGPRPRSEHLRSGRRRVLSAGTRRPTRCETSRSSSSNIAPFALPGLPRFAGGAVGYAAYDAVRYTEAPARRPP